MKRTLVFLSLMLVFAVAGSAQTPKATTKAANCCTGCCPDGCGSCCHEGCASCCKGK